MIATQRWLNSPTPRPSYVSMYDPYSRKSFDNGSRNNFGTAQRSNG